MLIESISVIKDVCLSLAAVVTASVAIYGLSRWKKELTGKVYFDVARGLIRATYKLRDEIEYGRSPFTSAQEFPKDYDRENKTPKKEAEAWTYIYTNRWKPIAEAIQEFEAQVLEAEALWGVNIKNIALELKRCATTLRAAMQAVIDNEANGGKIFESDQPFAEKIRSEVWSGWSRDEEKDKLSKKIHESVNKIETELRPHIVRN